MIIIISDIRFSAKWNKLMYFLFINFKKVGFGYEEAGESGLQLRIYKVVNQNRSTSFKLNVI